MYVLVAFGQMLIYGWHEDWPSSQLSIPEGIGQAFKLGYDVYVLPYQYTKEQSEVASTECSVCTEVARFPK